MSGLEVIRIDTASKPVVRAVHRLMMASYRVEGELLGVDDFKPLRRSEASILTATTLFLGIHSDRELVALVELDESDGDVIDISALVVAPSHFRLGLGRTLLAAVIDRYAGHDLTVSTGTANRPARRLYEQSGFATSTTWSTADGIPMVTLLRPA